MSELLVNGHSYEFTEPIYVRDILEKLGVEDSGIAIAVDSQVLQRNLWSEPIEGDTVEVLTAFQGG